MAQRKYRLSHRIAAGWLASYSSEHFFSFPIPLHSLHYLSECPCHHNSLPSLYLFTSSSKQPMHPATPIENLPCPQPSISLNFSLAWAFPSLEMLGFFKALDRRNEGIQVSDAKGQYLTRGKTGEVRQKESWTRLTTSTQPPRGQDPCPR